MENNKKELKLDVEEARKTLRAAEDTTYELRVCLYTSCLFFFIHHYNLLSINHIVTQNNSPTLFEIIRCHLLLHKYNIVQINLH